MSYRGIYVFRLEYKEIIAEIKRFEKTAHMILDNI